MAFHKKHLFEIDLQIISRFASIITHPARLEIINLLLESDKLDVRAIRRNLPLHEATVSHHLKKLRDLNLIDFEEIHPHIYYQINREELGMNCECLFRMLRKFWFEMDR